MKRVQGSRLTVNAQDDMAVHYDKREGKDHLGGCGSKGDGATYYPAMWDHMVEKYNIKSVIDVGCGYGFSSDYFKSLGLKVLGVEGSQGGYDDNFLPKEMLVQHDYERDGSYIPEEEFDLCWCCEFVEHVEESSMHNFFDTFKKAKYIAMTFASPGQGGHHHVNEQFGDYWINHIQALGYEVLDDDTQEMRAKARTDCAEFSPFYESHFISRGLIFKRKES
tara:strand:- start:7 stop:669 length:663 start_codon:yes stop_codon:yes gene_type:complete